MAVESAGILVYKRTPGGLQVFLVHPGGPFWARKDLGAWSIPMGEFEEGEVTITEDNQPPRTFKAGDTFFVPLATPCDWKSTGYVRKIYCIMQPKAAAAEAKGKEAAE